MVYTGDAQSLGQLVAAASRDVSALVRSEIELAKAEMRQDARYATRGGALFGGAALLALLALGLLSVAAVHGIEALGLGLGWSYLIVGVVYLVVAAVLALVAKRAMKRIRPPERTIRTAKDNVAMLRNHKRSSVQE
ncbi:phage holin family protein [Carbonactinospora thermoautotrophica]|uniref:Phage holin family protein n=1 Tax=Carbonactinospora thermoautotrophica TaxID=1469144 RepID=A0A132MLP2_9ACTN|nr:phage holin family protein [Carbonactinospora thermoautotrophica]KWW97488.1 hypothetical protein TH66_17800 [Carbonactinospora thermoautotrophica]KWW98774.1 hypothetical protein LI90_403 [Carbonactinospora thermoautotrophica]KWX09903.1 hypothetical protein TR74_06845 [Carbonactinospora thermoautotrophica]MCX9191380.1 phage holin family protein [Carbonactinospora thermoautotrophica]